VRVTIRTRNPDGRHNSEEFESEPAGRKVLDALLDAHRASGQTVAVDRVVYLVTDKDGNFVQRLEFKQSE
jgi:hypothetical protein